MILFEIFNYEICHPIPTKEIDMNMLHFGSHLINLFRYRVFVLEKRNLGRVFIPQFSSSMFTLLIPASAIPEQLGRLDSISLIVKSS